MNRFPAEITRCLNCAHAHNKYSREAQRQNRVELVMSRGGGTSLCPMCHFQSPTIKLSLNHLRLVHGSDPRFSAQCGIDGCSYTGRTFSALYSHIYRTHPECGVIQKRRSRLSPEQSLETFGEAARAAGSSESAGVQLGWTQQGTRLVLLRVT